MKFFYALSAALLLNACVQPPQQAKVRNGALAPMAAPVPPVAPPPGATAQPPAAPVQRAAVGGSLVSRADTQAFIREMVAKDGFNNNELQALFSRVRTQPEIIEAISRPAEAKPWYAYRAIFLTPQRIQGGVGFWRTHEAALAQAEQVYGVPAEIIVAIIGVETQYGGNTGKYRVLDALSTLAFDYPRRADYFRKELENYLLLTREEGIDPLSLKGSYAGAMGFGQFMPSSYRAYAVDFDGDRHRDLWSNPRDAIGSVANYLSRHRWQRGAPVAVPASVSGSQYQTLVTRKAEKPSTTVRALRQRGVIPQGTVSDEQPATLLELDGGSGPEYWLGFDNFYVITRYNLSPLYAMAVYQLSQEIRGQRRG